MGEEQGHDLLSAYLEGWAKSGQKDLWSYFNYSRAGDYKRLWLDCWTDGPDGGQSQPGQILIDWNGFPFQDLAFPKIVEFTTPFDWALGVAYRLVEKDPTRAKLPQIVIVDRCSYRYPGSFAVEMSQALVDALGGYVQVYSAFGGDDADPVALFHYVTSTPKQAPDTASSAVYAEEEPGTKEITIKPKRHALRQGQLRALRQAWIGYTVQSRDHHDINNLIGPLALAKGFQAGQGAAGDADIAEHALFQVAEWLELVESDEDINDDGWALESRLAQLATEEEPIAAILIDDQATRWAGFLESAFFGGRLNVYGISDPNKLLGLLSRAGHEGPFERCLSLDDGKGERDQVIFLDLRFFPRGGADERTFLTNVCNQILAVPFPCNWQSDQHFRDGPLSVRDQDLLSADDWAPANPLAGVEGNKYVFLQAVKRILDCPRISWENLAKSRLYDHLLTLFPRFLAQILFTTPIVLFSSTGRRDLTEHFRGYENIITAFEKPRLPVRHDQVTRSFRTAIDDAARLIGARKRLRQLAKAGEKSQRESSPADGHYHVELFIDEYFPDEVSNDPASVWVGGFYAIFNGDTLSAARAKAADFDDELVRQGFSYFSRGHYGPPLPQGAIVKNKKQAAKEELRNALQSRSCQPRWRGLARIKCDSRSAIRILESSGDDAYRRALAVLVETFLYEMLVVHFRALQKGQVSVSIFAGTRVTVAGASDPGAIGSLRQAAYRWGFAHKDNVDGGMRLESLTRSTLFPIISDLREFRRDRWSIERAVAVRMIYDFDRNKNGPSLEPQGHLVCRRCGTNHPVSIREAIESVQQPPAGMDWLRVSAVLNDKNNEAYAFLDPHDPAKQLQHQQASGRASIFFHSKTWGGLTLAKGVNVLAELRWESVRGFSVMRVQQIQAPVGGPAKGIEWMGLTTCPACGANGFLRPDYPGGLYIADEVMSDDYYYYNEGSYARIIGRGPLDFDDRLDDRLWHLIVAGRLADAGDRVNAALKAAAAQDESPDAFNSDLRRKILSRLAPNFAEMTGSEFHRVALALSSVSDESPSLGDPIRVILSGFVKSLSEAQVDRIVRTFLESHPLKDCLMSITASKSRNSGNVTCKVFCAEPLARWFVDCRKQTKELGLAWAHAAIQ